LYLFIFSFRLIKVVFVYIVLRSRILKTATAPSFTINKAQFELRRRKFCALICGQRKFIQIHFLLLTSETKVLNFNHQLSLLSRSITTMNRNVTVPNCPLCNLPHSLRKCKFFTNKVLNGRFLIVKTHRFSGDHSGDSRLQLPLMSIGYAL